MTHVRSRGFGVTRLNGALRATGFLLLASIGACTGGSSVEHTGTVDSNLSGASASRDVDTPQANVVDRS